MSFLWFKALHLIGIICWFAALFYLPRLFVYHSMLGGSEHKSYERFLTMERKLLRAIAYPSLIVTLVFGMLLVATNIEYYLSQSWFLLKMLMVALVWVYHGFCHYYYKQFALNNNQKSHRYFRVFNELAVLTLISIVILVVVKPLF